MGGTREVQFGVALEPFKPGQVGKVALGRAILKLPQSCPHCHDPKLLYFWESDSFTCARCGFTITMSEMDDRYNESPIGAVRRLLDPDDSRFCYRVQSRP